MGKVIALIVILPFCMAVVKVVEHGYAWMLAMPLFCLVAFLPARYFWMRAVELRPLLGLVGKGALVAVLAWLAHYAYVGALPASQFPPVALGHVGEDEVALWYAWGGLCVLWLAMATARIREPI